MMPISDKQFDDFRDRTDAQIRELIGRYQSLQSHIDRLADFDDGVRRESLMRSEAIDKKIEGILSMLTGSGHDRGLLLRVDRLERPGGNDTELRLDRLEQSETRRTWLLRTTIATAIAAIVAAILEMFHR